MRPRVDQNQRRLPAHEASRIERLELPAPFVRAARYHTRELYRGIKEVFAVVYIEHGRSEWWARGRVWQSGPGTLALKQPGDVHRDLARDGDSRFQVIVFDTPLIDEAREAAGHRGPPVLRRSQIEPGDPAGAAFRHLHALAAGCAADVHHQATDRLTLESVIYEAVAALADELSADQRNDPRARWRRPVRRAIDLMRARFVEPLTLDEIAAYAGLDKFHLSRAFRTEVGLPPHAYLTHLRVAEARALLLAGVAPSEVASRVGFCDQSQLHRHFRRIVGTTPGRWTREKRGSRSGTHHRDTLG